MLGPPTLTSISTSKRDRPEFLSSRKVACEVLCRQRTRIGRDEAIVAAMLQDLPNLLSSLESLSER